MKQVDGVLVGVGLALCIAIVGGIWKAAQLRSDTVNSFRNRMILAEGGLDDLAAVALRRLAVRVSEVLGGLDDNFVPGDVIKDPNELSSMVAEIGILLRARRRLPRYYRGLQSIGPLLLTTLIPLLVATLAALSYFTGWRRDRLPGYVGLWVAVSFAGLIVMLACYFIYLHMRFSRAEILSQGVTT